MNRQERRRRGILRKDPVLNLRREDITRMKNDATEKAAKRAFDLMLAIPSMVIHDHFGGLMRKEGRVERFVDLCTEQYRCFEEGYVTIEDLGKILKDEAGVEFESWK